MNSDISEALNAINITYHRTSLLAEDNFYIRKLNLVANTWIEPTNSTARSHVEATTRNIIKNRTNELQTTEFNIFKISKGLETRINRSISSSKVLVKNKLNNGAIQSFENTYDDAVFQYISEASQIAETKIEYLVDINTISTPSTEITNADRAFYSVIENGLHVIRSNSEAIENDIVEFFRDEFDKAKLNFIITKCTGFALIIIEIILLIYIVIKVINRNEQVLTLFARINQADIKKIIEKNELYLNVRLSERVYVDEISNAESEMNENSATEKDSKDNNQEDEEKHLESENDDEIEESEMQTEKPNVNVFDSDSRSYQSGKNL